TVMTERDRGITSTLQTFQQPDLQSLLFRLAAKGFDQSLQLASLGQITHFKSMAENEFAIFRQLLGIRVFVYAIDRRDEAVLQVPPHRFVGRDHEFLDQLIRFVILDSFEPQRTTALAIDHHLDLRKIQIERAMSETPAAQERGQFPRRMQT